MPAVKFLDVPDDDTQTEVAPPKSERDETQRQIDAVFKSLLDRWVKAGRPSPEKSPAHRYVVAKSDVTTLKGMIRRAGALHKHEPRFYRDLKREDGTVSVKFTVAAKPPKPADAPANAPANAPTNAPKGDGKTG